MLQSVFVKGEVSNCKYHASGHIYFTLKDPKGVVSCVMFAGNRAGLSFRLAEGQQVVVGGTVDVYERDGKYQLYARQIMLDGSGLLYEKYEKMKRELEEAGYFAKECKKPIPKYIKTLGVVTAGTGAAVRDIIQIAHRRNPYVQIILYPAIVQGEYAVPSIINGIRALEQIGVDVMIVGRGGGSIEDLWAFNEREVALTVFDCTVPIISAVGHETDTTIIDFVSDLRAPTPSAAAELAVTDIRDILGEMEELQNGLLTAMQRRLSEQRRKLENFSIRLQAKNPAARIREHRFTAVRLEERLQESMKQMIINRRHRLAMYITAMKGLSPLEKLNSGYSYVTNEAGHNLKSVKGMQPKDLIQIRFADGTAKAEVTEVQTEG